MPRTSLSTATRREVLMEAGYRCAVPTCRNILALDIHHIVEVSEGGGDDVSNLIALCPTCHALYTRGIITKDAINCWKMMLVSLNNAFDKDTISNLLFLKNCPENVLGISGDGVLHFSHLIASGLAKFNIKMQNGPIVLYSVSLTEKGMQLTDAWFSGERDRVKDALSLVS